MATAERNQSRRGGTLVSETYRGTEEADSLTAAIIDAVAAAAGVDPTDHDLGLYEAVDLEALEALFARQSDDCRFEFSVEEYRVVVEGDGHVVVFEE